ncbi:MAG: choice-of-anchor D domain-containing protein, partial [Chloroflexi bacterium]|nr:choice-of-anchor D domain-containing protein [Chloroflexota bacterium]
MKITYNRKRNIFSIPLRLGLVIIQVFMLVGVTPASIVRADTSHINNFTTPPFTGNPASFSTGTAATGLSYTCSGADGCTFGHQTTLGDGGTAHIDVLSTAYNTSNTETISITSRDGQAFNFVSIWLDVAPGSSNMTITGDGPESFSFVVNAGNSGTYSPPGGAKLVTSVKLTSTDFVNDFIDTVSTWLDVPGIDVQGNNTTIINGDTTPVTADGTDLGLTPVGTPTTQDFDIRSIGDDPLDLTGSPYVSISGHADLTISAQPTTDPIASGNSDSFTVQCNPSGTGVRTATVSIDNDSEASPYTFAVQCTGTTPPPGDITVVKEVIGDAPASDWAFNGSGDMGGSFTLPAAGGSQDFLGLSTGSYTIGETQKPGYSASVSCDNGASGTDSVTFDLNASDDVTCTFINTQDPPTGDITVVKEVIGDAPASDWAFSGSGDMGGSFTLPAAGGSQDFLGLSTGSYTIGETQKPGYSASVSCDNGASG